MDYTEQLRRLAVNDERLTDERRGARHLDARTLGLVRVAALVAVDGPEASFAAETDAAIGAGATPAEIVDVVTAVITVVGLPRAVAAAPRLARALGCDLEFTDDAS